MPGLDNWSACSKYSVYIGLSASIKIMSNGKSLSRMSWCKTSIAFPIMISTLSSTLAFRRFCRSCNRVFRRCFNSNQPTIVRQCSRQPNGTVSAESPQLKYSLCSRNFCQHLQKFSWCRNLIYEIPADQIEVIVSSKAWSSLASMFWSMIVSTVMNSGCPYKLIVVRKTNVFEKECLKHPVWISSAGFSSFHCICEFQLIHQQSVCKKSRVGLNRL